MTGRDLSGLTVMVLGGRGALGRAVVARLRLDGASVVAADARPPGDDSAEDSASLRHVTVDVLDEGSVSAALAAMPTPMAVVNVVGGYAPPQGVPDLDIGVLRQQFDLNLVSAAIVTKYAMPLLTAQGGGAVVHTASRVAVLSGEGSFSYSATKLGVVRLVEAAAAEGKGADVRVNCILPSIIDTPANRAAIPGADHDLWPKPEQLAAVLSFLVSDDAMLISGAAIPVYGRV